jgi:hypothetical protein
MDGGVHEEVEELTKRNVVFSSWSAMTVSSVNNELHIALAMIQQVFFTRKKQSDNLQNNL